MNQREKEIHKLQKIRSTTNRVHSLSQKIFTHASNVVVARVTNATTVHLDDEALHKKIEHVREQTTLWMIRLQELVEEAVDSLKTME